MIKWFKALTHEEKWFYINVGFSAVFGVVLIVLKNIVFWDWDFTKYAAELELGRGLEDSGITAFIYATNIIQLSVLVLVFLQFFRLHKKSKTTLLASIVVVAACLLNGITCWQYFNVFAAISYSSPMKYILIINQIFHIIFALIPVWLILTRNREKREK